MIIPLDDTHHIEPDTHCWVLVERRVPDPRHHATRNPGEARDHHIGYCATLAQALRLYTDRVMQTAPGRGIDDLRAVLANVERTIEQATARIEAARWVA